jgi:hypothetical protein
MPRYSKHYLVVIKLVVAAVIFKVNCRFLNCNNCCLLLLKRQNYAQQSDKNNCCASVIELERSHYTAYIQPKRVKNETKFLENLYLFIVSKIKSGKLELIGKLEKQNYCASVLQQTISDLLANRRSFD